MSMGPQADIGLEISELQNVSFETMVDNSETEHWLVVWMRRSLVFSL